MNQNRCQLWSWNWKLATLYTIYPIDIRLWAAFLSVCWPQPQALGRDVARACDAHFAIAGGAADGVGVDAALGAGAAAWLMQMQLLPLPPLLLLRLYVDFGLHLLAWLIGTFLLNPSRVAAHKFGQQIRHGRLLNWTLSLYIVCQASFPFRPLPNLAFKGATISLALMAFSLTKIAKLPEPIGFFQYLPSLLLLLLSQLIHTILANCARLCFACLGRKRRFCIFPIFSSANANLIGFFLERG